MPPIERGEWMSCFLPSTKCEVVSLRFFEKILPYAFSYPFFKKHNNFFKNRRNSVNKLYLLSCAGT